MIFISAGSCPSLTEVASSTNTTLNLDGLQQGSVVEVTCETGYNMQGAGRLLCTMSGSWSEVEVPSCELSQCLVPWIANGAASPVQDTILYGETVTVTCDSGYDLQGSTVLECGLDGAFNASSPTCTGKTYGRKGTKRDFQIHFPERKLTYFHSSIPEPVMTQWLIYIYIYIYTYIYIWRIGRQSVRLGHE